MIALGKKAFPYSYTRCLFSKPPSTALQAVAFLCFLLLTIVFETATLPIYPLVFRLHRTEPAHRGG